MIDLPNSTKVISNSLVEHHRVLVCKVTVLLFFFLMIRPPPKSPPFPHPPLFRPRDGGPGRNPHPREPLEGGAGAVPANPPDPLLGSGGKHPPAEGEPHDQCGGGVVGPEQSLEHP